MSGAKIYRDDGAIALAKASADVHLSLCAWVCKLVKEQTSVVGVNGYTLANVHTFGFFGAVASPAQLWRDFPLAQLQRTNQISDLPHEA